MKKIVAKNLVLIIGTTMVVIMLLNILIQREDAMKAMEQNAKLVIDQIDNILIRNEQEILKKNEVRYILSQMPVPKGTSYYVVAKKSMTIIGATDRLLLGTDIEEILGESITEQNKGKVIKSEKEGKDGNYYYFLEKHNHYIGIAQTEELVFANLKNNAKQLGLYLLLATAVMVLFSMFTIERLIIRSVKKVVEGVQAITNGKLDTVIREDRTPEFKILSDNINQMTGSLLDHTVKISQILDAVDMLVAVYEYGEEGTRVLATGKMGALLMLSEEETVDLLEDKYKFEEKIDEIKKNPVDGYKKVYRLPSETECYLQIETFHNQKTKFGVILDVTEQIIEKHLLQTERDSDLLTGLLTRRAFYGKMDALLANPKQIKNAVLLMCDLDGLKQFNDTYGHANGDKAIKKAGEIMNSLKDKNSLVSRLSGDEFVIFLYGEENESSLIDKIKSIKDTMLEARVEIFGKNIDVRLSGGYVFYHKHPEKLDKLLKKADQAMYESKKGGRSRFTEYIEKTEDGLLD